ncbi:transcriptional regulator with XRE-family HTH domain [Muricomes intestini]|uniref:Transcriptional regulator with XRE-family HTH domain n=1 Tax=Muricomes intestini TaxID=1796634 RepID=A0A4R3K6B7_9FIRM|nr:helix-turn-helix transcriptional regulator [Muricomes intestini]TCS78349.1 transcriptional regulator with XRE-family HTH domain [Muricomes intestini]
MGLNDIFKIGDRIKELRKDKGMSAKETAKELNIKYPTYSNYENNNRTPDYKTLVKIAEYYGINPRQLALPPGWKISEKDGVSIERVNVEQIDDINRQKLLYNYEKLNESGKKEASKRVWEMTRLKEYQKDNKAVSKESDKEEKVSTRKATQEDMDLF